MRRPRAARRLAAFLALLLPAAADALATDYWPQWRGPHRDGVAAAIRPAGGWPKALKPQWKVEVGEGHASPIVSGDRIFLHSRQGENEVVSRASLSPRGKPSGGKPIRRPMK